ncbi:MAG: efflux transporter, family, subunit [Gammaproteobacteria bacterium]|jgi:multidrug efflux system membrane fusion protein|nr:efflux transporter, family, subunit [Gammaproteobacteria bacterium]
MVNDNPDGSATPREDVTASSDTAPPASRWRRKRVWIAAAAILVVGLLLLHRFTTPPPKPAGGRGQQQNTAITVGQSRTGDIGVYVSALGTVTPIYTVTVYSQITGRVMEVRYREGQMVRKGEPLIDIDPRPYQATLTQAQGTLQHDAGLLAQARMDLKRYQDAYARNGIAKQQLDDQQQLVVQYEGTVKADQGTVAYDQVQLEYCHIVSPIAGRVGLRLVDPGNTVFAGSSATLIVITQLQPITVVFNVSEDDLPRVQAQLKGDNKLAVDVFDRANDHRIESGSLASLDNQVDTMTGTVRFRAELPNTELALFPNQFVNARLLVEMLKNATLVPTVAIQHNGTSDFVYVVKADNTVAVQNVAPLTSNEQDTAVTGLNRGVRVATSGFDRLENGVRVAVRTAGPQQAPGRAQTQHGQPATGTASKSTNGGTASQ